MQKMETNGRRSHRKVSNIVPPRFLFIYFDFFNSNNQRQQNAANKEAISLRAQVKVLEMRVNSLQSQIEQKNRENEELTHIVDELIGKKS